MQRSDAAASGLRPSAGGAGLLQLEPVCALREGGEGRVVLTYDPALARWLAVKFLRLKPGARAFGELLLGKLGAYAKELLEPALAPILASGLSDTAPAEFRTRFDLARGLDLYVVMPYVHGLPAHELATGPLGAREAAALFVGAARLLARLHGQGLLHLDLKPANVIVDVQGRVALVDPLLALVQGTSAYAAPDAELGRPADRYALGRLVAAVWTGRYPRSERDGLPELPQPGVELSGKERLAHGRFQKQLELLASANPQLRELDLAAAEAFAADLGAADGPATLAAQVARSPFRKTLANIEQAQAMHLEPSDGIPLASSVPSLPRDEGRVSRAMTFFGGAVLGVVALVCAFVVWRLQHPTAGPTAAAAPAPTAPAPPPVAPAPDDDDGVFTHDAPVRQGPAVRIGEKDKIAKTRALFEMQLAFPARRIAVLDRHAQVVDAIARPAIGPVYRWDVQPGIVTFEVDRGDEHPDIEQFFLGPGQKRLMTPPRNTDSAPQLGDTSR